MILLIRHCYAQKVMQQFYMEVILLKSYNLKPTNKAIWFNLMHMYIFSLDAQGTIPLTLPVLE